jgi:hypothetical protein
MVPFNVALTDGPPLRAHRATDGALIVDQAMSGLAETLRVEGLPVTTSSDMESILWGKLLLNLNNALNALSGLPLAEELADRRWRKLLATQMDEAIAAMAAAGINPAKLAGVPPGLLPKILRLPDWLFRRGLADAGGRSEARSSMWDDLSLGRPTEIDEFQGAILRLSEQTGSSAAHPTGCKDDPRGGTKAGSPQLNPDQIATDPPNLAFRHKRPKRRRAVLTWRATGTKPMLDIPTAGQSNHFAAPLTMEEARTGGWAKDAAMKTLIGWVESYLRAAILNSAAPAPCAVHQTSRQNRHRSPGRQPRRSRRRGRSLFAYQAGFHRA